MSQTSRVKHRIHIVKQRYHDMRHKLHLYLIYMLSFDDRRMRQNKFSNLLFSQEISLYVKSNAKGGSLGVLTIHQQNILIMKPPSAQNVLM